MSQTTQPVAGIGGPTATTYEAKAFAAASPTAALGPMTIRRREPGPHDVQIDVLFCGICHSDLHQVRNEWQSVMPTVYPAVVGHEIVGRVARVGGAVRKFKEGDLAAVGCMVDSCRTCSACREGQEQFCEGPATFTYNSPDKHLGGVTYGGYLEQRRGRRGLHAAGLGPLGSRRDGASALRRHHHVLAASALERPQTTHGRHRGARRPGTHRREVRPHVGRARGGVHDVARQR